MQILDVVTEKYTAFESFLKKDMSVNEGKRVVSGVNTKRNDELWTGPKTRTVRRKGRSGLRPLQRSQRIP